MNTPSIDAMRAEYQHALMPVTLCYLVREGEVLLGLKQKKVGAGFWNGYGGKVEPGETVEEAMVREVEEELGVKPLSYREGAILEFYWPEDLAWNMRCFTYFADSWDGEPQATEEMATPTWFKHENLPMEAMWQSDTLWLPEALTGKHVQASFMFGPGNAMLEHQVIY